MNPFCNEVIIPSVLEKLFISSSKFIERKFIMIRTRVAPSPTGDPHVGTAYMALFNYCFAKRNGGKFILRIENTDQVRSSVASEQVIMHSLKWLGLEWDEGPDINGPYGPYRQSDRSDIYQDHIKKLLESGHAFKCFCKPERLEALRKKQMAEDSQTQGYDGLCKKLTESEVSALEAEGATYVIRLDVPREGTCNFKDYLRGDISIEWKTVDMQVLIKSDGLPTYHLANVVDDHLMEITHVIRGEEWISSVPKHILLYKYFGWEPPVFCHLPLLRNPDKSKLSKRKNPTSILWYERMGYLPEGLLNFLGLMAWSMPSGEERFSLSEMIENFDLGRVSLGGPVFDIQKLTWLNGRWIREVLDLEQFAERIRQWSVNRDYMMKIAQLAMPRTTCFSDLGPLTAFLFSGSVNIKPEDLVDSKMSADDVKKVFHIANFKFDSLPEWNKESVESTLRNIADQMKLKLKLFLRPFYVAISGNPVSLPLFDSMEILGRDICRYRLRNAIEILGSVSAREGDLWLEEFSSATATSMEAKK
jgi:glutamyl-tRNA synthetase